MDQVNTRHILINIGADITLEKDSNGAGYTTEAELFALFRLNFTSRVKWNLNCKKKT